MNGGVITTTSTNTNIIPKTHPLTQQLPQFTSLNQQISQHPGVMQPQHFNSAAVAAVATMNSAGLSPANQMAAMMQVIVIKW